MSIKDYKPTPEQIEGEKQIIEERKLRCEDIDRKWKLKIEEKKKPKKR
jgi:hypothetical protein